MQTRKRQNSVYNQAIELSSSAIKSSQNRNGKTGFSNRFPVYRVERRLQWLSEKQRPTMRMRCSRWSRTSLCPSRPSVGRSISRLSNSWPMKTLAACGRGEWRGHRLLPGLRPLCLLCERPGLVGGGDHGAGGSAQGGHWQGFDGCLRRMGEVPRLEARRISDPPRRVFLPSPRIRGLGGLFPEIALSR